MFQTTNQPLINSSTAISLFKGQGTIPPLLPEHRVWCPRAPPRSHHYAHNGIHQWLGMMLLNGDFMVILWDFKAWFMMDIIGISWGIWPNYILVAQARGDELTAITVWRITMVMICTSIRWGAASRTRKDLDIGRMFGLTFTKNDPRCFNISLM